MKNVTHIAAASLERATRTTAQREIMFTWAGIALVMLACIMLAGDMGVAFRQAWHAQYWSTVILYVTFFLCIAFLIYGSFVYLFTRLAYQRRLCTHRPASRAELDGLYRGPAPTLTILVPSYKEDADVVTQTLWSAVLQDYPHRRVVLLIDNPPLTETATDAAELLKMRTLPARLQKILARPRKRFAGALTAFQRRTAVGAIDPEQELVRVARLYAEVATWFEDLAQGQNVSGHADVLFVEKILHWHRDAHASLARDLRQRLLDAPRLPDLGELLGHYRRLAALFSAEVSAFERKLYTNLSHESNKAMNLNSYIGLVGKSFCIRKEGGHRALEQVDPALADFHVADTDYFITLDADSLILPDYALRLVHHMQQPVNARVAVAQTPYSAIPAATGALERIAGATTDIQYLIHQGFTGYDATYWVGANALLRKTALLDIAVTEVERGFSVTRYIQDCTVIQDTESSIDLVAHGWSLYNYPERLAYRATPPDFGALVIQRRRWANGGLIILPKLLRYLLRNVGRRATLAQGFMRFHYLTSIAAVNIGLLVLLAVPFKAINLSPWLPLTALPYFLFYLRDLTLMGYRKTDLLRVYALNLLLIPVNIGGVLKSVQQALRGTKIPFARTPKVAGRTIAPPLYILAAGILIVHWSAQAGLDLYHHLWAHGLFAAVNAAFLAYAFVVFVGLRAAQADIRASLRGVPPPASASVPWHVGQLIRGGNRSVSTDRGMPAPYVIDWRARKVASQGSQGSDASRAYVNRAELAESDVAGGE